MNEIRPPSGYRIENVMTAWMATREGLLESDPSLEHDEAALAELLGPVEGDVDDVLARLLRAARHAKSQAEALNGMLDDMRAREKRFLDRAATLRTTALTIMQTMDWQKREFPDFSVSVTPGALSVDVKDPDAIPDIYVETVRKADKATILSVLKSGGAVPGAELARGLPSLRVRT